MKKIFVLSLIIVMVLSFANVCFAKENGKMKFADVSSDAWYYDAVRFNFNNDLIKGYNDLFFGPNDNLTRGMLVTILYRMENSPKNNGVSEFSDVENNKWYSKAIKWAVSNDIVHGYGDGKKFGPNDNVIRQDVAVILRNYTKSKGKNVECSSSNLLNSKSDADTISGYAASAMKWAVENKVITGNSDGTLNPKGFATRAEAAAMIQKYCISINGAKNIEHEEKNMILYNGLRLNPVVGAQWLDNMEYTSENKALYETKYYNYDKRVYYGVSQGEFLEVYENWGIVGNIEKIAMTKDYNAIPRMAESYNGLPQKLMDMADCTTVDIEGIDLDNDGKKEYVVCYTWNYSEGEIEGAPYASSGIMLFDSEFNKIANMVHLSDGFWGNIRTEDFKVFLGLDRVEYIDIDNDGIMEIIIDVPTYEGTKVSIVKYCNGIYAGASDLEAYVYEQFVLNAVG